MAFMVKQNVVQFQITIYNTCWTNIFTKLKKKNVKNLLPYLQVI